MHGRRWALLGAVGLTHERWLRLSHWQRRAVVLAAVGVGAILVSVLVNVLEISFGKETSERDVLSLDLSALVAYGVLCLVLIPPWNELPAVPVRLALPIGVALALVVGIAVGVGFDRPALAFLLGAGLVLALLAPPFRSRRRRRTGASAALSEGEMPLGRKVKPLVVLVLAITFPFWAGEMFTLPIFGAWPSTSTAVVMLIFVMMAVGLNIVVGYAGLLDLGYVAFYAMGAYVAAWLASTQFAGARCPTAGFGVDDCPVATVPDLDFSFGGIGISPGLGGIHISLWLLIAFAGLVTAGAGVLIGLPTLRLRGDYLAIVTLGFGEILPQVARNGNDFFGTGFNLTGGPQGITPVDTPGFGSTLSDWTGGLLPANYLLHPESARVFYWTALLLLCFTVFCSLRLRDSRLGRAWVAIREDEIAAAAMGVPLMRTKTWAYACGAFFGGVAGAYYAGFKSSTFPQDFYFNFSVFVLSMVILGGMGNVWGVMFGAAFLAYLDREGLANTGAWINEHFGTSFDVPLYSSGIYGVLIVLFMLFRPQGLLPSSRRKRELELGVHDEYEYDLERAT